MDNTRRQLQRGFAWLPVIIAIAVMGILGGGTTLYNVQQKRQAEVDALRQETAELKQVIATEEKRADASPLPTPEPSPSPTPEVKAAITETSELSREERCEIEALDKKNKWSTDFIYEKTAMIDGHLVEIDKLKEQYRLIEQDTSLDFRVQTGLLEAINDTISKHVEASKDLEKVALNYSGAAQTIYDETFVNCMKDK